VFPSHVCRPPDEQPPDPFADRVVNGLIQVVVERGFEETEESEIAAAAGLAEADFRQRYSDKEQCATAVFEQLIQDFMWRSQRAYDSQARWPATLRAAAYEAAEWMEEHPEATRFGAVEILAAKSEMLRVRREQFLGYCSSLMDAGRAVSPRGEELPEGLASVAIGSAAGPLMRRLPPGDKLTVVPIVQPMMYQVVRLYLDESEAQKELTAPRPGPPACGTPAP